MSCMIMNPEPMAAIANAAATLLNCGYECQSCGYYEATEIYKKLYAVNIAAYNGRYKDHEAPLDDLVPSVDCFRYIVHQKPEYAEHHHAVRPWHYRLAKLLDFWLYQTDEYATWEHPVRSAMLDFQEALFQFIVQRSSEYDNAPEWGKL